jgi:hypothetical protein
MFDALNVGVAQVRGQTESSLAEALACAGIIWSCCSKEMEVTPA